MKPRYRGSEMPRILGCNGSLTLAPMVAPTSSEDGYEGSLLHWMIADTLIREYGAQPPEGGLPPPSVPPGYKLPKPSEWIVGWAVRHVRDTIPSDWSLLVECEFIAEFGTWVSIGHHDIFAISPDRKSAKGKDWKTGNKPVEPALFNEQINSYMVQAARDFEELEELEFEICQPRASEDEGIQKISKVRLVGDQIKRSVEVLDARVRSAQANRMELSTGLVQCCYCPAQNQCPAIHALIENMKITLTPEMLAGIRKETPDAVLGDIAVAAKVLDKPFETAKEVIKERIAANGSLIAGDGTIISAKVTGGSYSVIDPVAFYKALCGLVVNAERRAKALSFPFGRIRTAVAEEMNIPETGKAPITAEKIVDAQLKPYAEQGTKTILQFQ